MAQVYIGLGSNLGDRLDNLAVAVDLIAHIPTTHVEAVSRAYESEPAGTIDQPAFANAVLEASTDLLPEQLIAALKDVEVDMGRDPLAPVGGPRVIDLDILLFDDADMTSEAVTIPHPRMAERDFVIRPLLEIAPDATWPDGTPVTAEGATEGRIVGELGPIRDLGAGHNQPLSEEEWVVVAQADETQAVVSAPDFRMMYLASVLEEEGYAIAWEPSDPAQSTEPLGVGLVLRLLVPASQAERARELVASADAAIPVGEDDQPDPEDSSR